MARVRDLLYRLRPSGAPGAANTAGVPADRAREQTTELRPVLALLAATEQQCSEIVDLARGEATEIRARCVDEARSTLAAARSRQAVERAAAAAGVQQGGRALTRSAAVAAQRHEDEVRQQAAGMMQVYVDQVVEAVRSMIDHGVPARTKPSGPP